MTLGDKRLARISTVLFCLNPASIFLSACYSESVFGLFVLLGLVYRPCRLLCWVAAGFIRSNGFLLAGFYIYDFLKHRKPRYLLFSLMMFTGYVSFNLYSSKCYCPTERPYCGMIPDVYSYVQNHYWGVGFLQYWTLKQIPNFLIASPLIVFSFFGIYSYLKHRPYRLYLQKDPSCMGYYHDDVFPHILLWLVIVLICLFVGHVQIIYRFSSTLVYPMYWYGAHLMMSSNVMKRFIPGFSLLYGSIGIVLFAAFYPPA